MVEYSSLCVNRPPLAHYACATPSIERRRLRRGWRGVTVQRMGWLVSTGLSRPLTGLPMGRAEQAARSVHWHKGSPAGSLLCRLHTPAPYGLQDRHSGTVPQWVQKPLLCPPPPHHRAIPGFLGVFKHIYAGSPAGPPEATSRRVSSNGTVTCPTSGARQWSQSPCYLTQTPLVKRRSGGRSGASPDGRHAPKARGLSVL